MSGRRNALFVLLAAAALAAAAPVSARAEAPAPAFEADLPVRELGFDGSFRIRMLYQPGYIPIPANAGHLFLVAADSAAGAEAFFIPTDLALELGSSQVYRVEFEQASDLFGQALGGRLRPGETQLGFVLVPPEADVARFLPDHPDSVRIRYANRRASFRPADPDSVAEWDAAAPRKLLAAGLNAWWDWDQAMEQAPEMTAGEKQFLAARLFSGQGQLLAEEGIPAEALRNAILRVGERRLQEGPARQRVAPRYPTAVRQAGIGGLVVVLCYVNPEGEVGDATVLASNTVHLLNLSALSAVMDWRFPPTEGPDGKPVDGWRLLPMQFKPPEEVARAESETDTTFVPPRVVKPVEPEYPERARQKRIEGTVVYRVTIGADGRLIQATLEHGVNPLLDEAALHAVEQSLFVPASRNGKPVRAELLLPFTFGKPR